LLLLPFFQASEWHLSSVDLLDLPRSSVREISMMANTGQGPVLLMKKLGGMFALVLGAALAVAGYAAESTEAAVVGVVLLVVGAVLLALKIVRRNQGNQLG
jgi:predicted phage tail protein